MKTSNKIKIFLSISLILVISVSLVSAAITNTPEKQDKDIPNPFSSIINVLTGIKDVLGNMLVQLNIIAQKNTTVLVNPTPITVQPNITINPNITIPNKDCNWEKLNQEFSVNLGSGESTGFFLPEGIGYSNVTISKMLVDWDCETGCYIQIGDSNAGPGNVCDGTYIGIKGLLDSPNCLPLLKEGINRLSVYSYNLAGSIKGIYVEMEVKPANC